jgi:hypothetical protein
MTVADYDALLEAQGGTCALCDATTADLRGYPLYVDHCHTTGRVRGLLCRLHNMAIATLGDSVESLHRAVCYLEDA